MNNIIMPAIFENHIYGVPQAIPSNLISVIGQSIGVGKKSAVWNGKSSIMCRGQAIIANAKFLLIKK